MSGKAGMRAFFTIYQYLVPLMLFPISYVLWLRHYGGQHAPVLLALSMPVVSAYIVPGLGTNWLKLWEFNTRLRMGRFRPHHGFVFGTATSLLALLCVPPLEPVLGWFGVLRAAFVMGSVLAFWNWWYDIYAIKAGVLRVYNRPYAARQEAAAIATDYAPVYFGAFGAAYGAMLHIGQYMLLVAGRTDWLLPLLVLCNLVVLVVPVLAYVVVSYVRTGTAGLSPVGREL
jgi:hypothetical protein